MTMRARKRLRFRTLDDLTMSEKFRTDGKLTKPVGEYEVCTCGHYYRDHTGSFGCMPKDFCQCEGFTDSKLWSLISKS